MKILHIFLLLTAFNICYGQNGNVYITNFDVENSALSNGKIEFHSQEGDTTYNFRLVVGRTFPQPLPAISIKVLPVFVNYGTEYAASDTIYLNQTDFDCFDGTSTSPIHKTFTLKSGKKEGTLKLKYQFLTDAPGYDGWTNWFYEPKEYQSQQYKPDPAFSGPESICDEGVFTITNPGTVTLENADNIATLTNLGGNQYKVTRIGNASGVVILTSTVNNQSHTKEISVGVLKPKSIGGVFTNLNWSNTYIYTVETVKEGEILDIEKNGQASVVFNRIDNNTFSITTPAEPVQTGPVPWMYTITVQARTVNECGHSDYITREITIGQGTPFQ